MRRLALCLLGAALLLAPTGCDDADEICRPAVPAGRIQGYVRTGGLAIDAVVAATRIVDGVASRYPLRAVPDERGFYFLDVPAGRYVLALLMGYSVRYDYAAARLGHGNVPPDTLDVDAAHLPRVIDFDLGGLTFGMDLSHALDGREGQVVLHARDIPELASYERRCVLGGEAQIQDGRLDLEIPGILPGEYQVEIVLDSANGGERFWLPDTRDRAASPWYRIEADAVVALSARVATEPARLEGSVTGAWQAMGLTSVPELSVVTVDSVIVVERRPVFPDGRFAIDLHVPCPVKLLVRQSDVEQWIGGPGFAAATVYDPRPGETISGLDVVQCGLHLTVAKPDADGSSAKLNFYDPVDLKLLASASAYLGSNAEIGIPNLWPGQYILSVSPWEGSGLVLVGEGGAAWRPQWFDRAATAAEARLITIPAAGQIVPLDLILERGGEIGGRVASEAESPTSHYVLLTPADAGVVSAYVYVWTWDPEFMLRGLPDGDYKVGACPAASGWDFPAPPPAGTVWYPDTTDWAAADVLSIREAGVITDLVIPVP